MNISRYTQTFTQKMSNDFDKRTDKIRFSIVNPNTGRLSGANSDTKDDLVNRFYNLTDSLPRTQQLSFAAAIVANRVMAQGMTDENHSFMKNLSSRFSVSEINEIKSQALNMRGAQSKDAEKLEALFEMFNGSAAKKLVGSENNITAPENTKINVSPEELYFRMSLLGFNTAKQAELA